MSDQPLRGRDAEIRRTREVLERVAHGDAALLLIEGAPGMGKSRLLREAASLAVTAGFTVVRTHADESDGALPLAPLLPLVQQLSTGRTRRPGGPADDETRRPRRQPLDQLVEAVELQARDSPVAVLVDDVHWADPATLLALRTLPARLAGSPIAWLMAARPVPDTALARLRERVGPGVMPLTGLSVPAAAEVAADLLGAPPDDSLAELLAGAAGNPFLIIELLRSAMDEKALSVSSTGARLDAPADLVADYGERIARQLEAMPPKAAELLWGASVLGREFELRTAARLLGRSAGQLILPVRQLLRTRLLEEAGSRLAFRHDLVRQAVADALPPPVRRALHREAADVLLALGKRPVHVVHHLLAGAGPGDVEAAGLLRAAAAEISGAAPDAAADLALGALELVPAEDPQRVESLVGAVRLLGAGRRMREALELAAEALALPVAPEVEASLRLTAAEIRIATGRYREALDQLHLALSMPDLPQTLRTTLFKTKGTAHLHLGEVETAETIGLGLVDAAYRDPDPAVVVSAMLFQSHVSLLRGRPARAVELAEAAVRHAAEHPAGIRLRPPRLPELWLATVLTSTERLGEADQLLRDGGVQAEASGAVWSLPSWHARRACLLLERGELGDAEAEADAALALGEELGSDQPDRTASAVLALVAIGRGDLPAAARQLAAGGQQPGVRPVPADPWGTCARLLLLAAQGDVVAAVAAGGRLYEAGSDAVLFALPPGMWPRLAAVALRAGARAGAEALGSALERLSPRDLSDRAVAAAAAHVRGLLSGDRAALEEAAAGHRSTLRPLAAVLAEEELARLAAADGRPHDAARWLREALGLALSCGATADAERLQRRLDGLHLRPGPQEQRAPAAKSGWESLTASELRVVQLVTEGLSNRAVADRLFLSPHTVNSHLRHVFAKLGVGTRVELTRIASARIGPDGPSARTGP